MQDVIYPLQGRALYKSPTTYTGPRVWQDVYNTQSHGLEICIKWVIAARQEVSAEMKRIRRRLHLSQKDAVLLLSGGGHNAFSG